MVAACLIAMIRAGSREALQDTMLRNETGCILQDPQAIHATGVSIVHCPPPIHMFTKATTLVHHWIEAHVQPGHLVVDATAGNGHDTLLLARCVGPEGQVVALDIQPQAIANTRARLADAGLLDRCALHTRSHADMADILAEEARIDCAVFNLGYLPGSDKAIVTRGESTLKAHRAVVERLAPGGVLFSTAYTGHEGGMDEADALVEWSRGLDGGRYSVARHEWINQRGQPPFVLIIKQRQ